MAAGARFDGNRVCRVRILCSVNGVLAPGVETVGGRRRQRATRVRRQVRVRVAVPASRQWGF